MFLKLKLRSTAETILVNADQIKYLYPERAEITLIYLVGESKQCVEVRESPDTIWKMMAKTGDQK
jgi:hypothetical protein